MKRQRAKLFIEKEFTAEQIQEFEPDFNPGNMDLVKAFAEGCDISLAENVRESFSFCDPRRYYKIIRPKMLINGIECEPFDSDKAELGDVCYTLDATKKRGIHSLIWGSMSDHNLINRIYTNKKHALHTAAALFGIKQ